MKIESAPEYDDETISFPHNNKDLISRFAYFPINVYIQRIKPHIPSRIRAAAVSRTDVVGPAQNLVVNAKHMHAICAANSIRFYAVLQPMNGGGNRKLTEQDKILLKVVKNQKISQTVSRFDFFIRYYNEIRKITKNLPYFYDFTDRFDNEKDQVFFDTVHFSDKGQRIIAQELYDLITRGDKK